MKETKTVRVKIENEEAKPDLTSYKNSKVISTTSDGQYIYYTIQYDTEEKQSRRKGFW